MVNNIQSQGNPATQSKSNHTKQPLKYSTNQPKVSSTTQALKANRSRESMLQNLLLPESEQTKNRSLLTKIQKQLANALDQKKVARARNQAQDLGAVNTDTTTSGQRLKLNRQTLNNIKKDLEKQNGIQSDRPKNRVQTQLSLNAAVVTNFMNQGEKTTFTPRERPKSKVV